MLRTNAALRACSAAAGGAGPAARHGGALKGTAVSCRGPKIQHPPRRDLEGSTDFERRPAAGPGPGPGRIILARSEGRAATRMDSDKGRACGS